MVDAADQEKIEASKNELHNLLDKPQLQGIPVSGLGAGPEAGGGGAAGLQKRALPAAALDPASPPSSAGPSPG